MDSVQSALFSHIGFSAWQRHFSAASCAASPAGLKKERSVDVSLPEFTALSKDTLVRSTGQRVCFVIEKLARRSGGAERVLIETANALAERGHQVEIITHEHRNAPPFYPLAPGVILSPLRDHRRPRWRMLVDRARRSFERSPEIEGLNHLVWLSRNGGFWRRLGLHLRAIRPAVAVAFMPPAVTALALARTDHPIRRVASMHNAPEQDFLNPERWDPSKLDRRRRLALMSRMDRIAVLLPEHRDWYPLALQPAISILPNAVLPVAPERLASAERHQVVMSVGRLASVKRHELLIDAWSRITHLFPAWTLRIFGEGPLRETLQARVDALNLRSVLLMGHTKDIADQYLASSILAHPAEFEGFPLAVTEALASGLPVVGFADCSGLNRLVENEVNGVLVPASGDRTERFAAALASLMSDGIRRRTMGLAGPGSVATYHPAIVIKMWEEMLFGDPLSRMARA